jgi:hypothetical protein
VILSGSAKPAVRLPLSLQGSLRMRNRSVAARGEERACRLHGSPSVRAQAATMSATVLRTRQPAWQTRSTR